MSTYFFPGMHGDALNFPSTRIVTKHMNARAIELTELKRELSHVPSNKLPEVRKFIRTLIPRAPEEKNIESLEGIWAGIGFEKIDNLEEEIRKLRKESEEQILKRFNNWNS